MTKKKGKKRIFSPIYRSKIRNNKKQFMLVLAEILSETSFDDSAQRKFSSCSSFYSRVATYVADDERFLCSTVTVSAKSTKNISSSLAHFVTKGRRVH